MLTLSQIHSGDIMNAEVRTINGFESIIKTGFHPEMKIDLLRKLIDNYKLVKKSEEKIKPKQ